MPQTYILNIEKLFHTCQAAGLPIVSLDALGRGRFERPLTAEEEQTFADLRAAHDPKDPRAEEQEARLKAGIHLEDLVEALWAAAAEDDDTALRDLKQRLKTLKEPKA
jgi:aryl-alcohol dehydrogenase-like predicted oxidoreductase